MCLISNATQAPPPNTGYERDVGTAMIVHSNPVYAELLDSPRATPRASPGDRDQDLTDAAQGSMVRDGYGFYELLCEP